MSEMHSIQPGFTYSTCTPFAKNKITVQKFKGTEDPSYIYRNKLDKVCFQYDMTMDNLKIY